MPTSALTSRFESDRIWDWYLENERRFRRYNSSFPEGHRGRWKSSAIAFVGLAPAHTPRGFTPTSARDHYELCEEWFSWRNHASYYSDRVIRQQLSWVPPVLLKSLDKGATVVNARTVPLRPLREFLDANVLMFDVLKLAASHTDKNACPVKFVRRQLWRVFHPQHPLRLMVVRHRRPIDQTIDILEYVDAGNVRLWSNGAWSPLDGFDGVRSLLERSTWPIIACDIPNKPDPLIVCLWHGWRCERYAIPDELPTALP